MVRWPSGLQSELDDRADVLVAEKDGEHDSRTIAFISSSYRIYVPLPCAAASSAARTGNR
ncbi:MAG: hypothetical protein ACLQEG_04375 [Acidimicrobiales bacterium]